MYEYECEACGEEYEELVALNAADSPPCPKCGSRRTKKKISACAGLGLWAGCGSGFS